MDTIALETLQQELKYAFKWMARATDSAKEGDFGGSVYAMTVAMQHWSNCQHHKDKFISDEDAEKIHWDFFTRQALNMAKKELENE